jgi:hypothetical protein
VTSRLRAKKLKTGNGTTAVPSPVQTGEAGGREAALVLPVPHVLRADFASRAVAAAPSHRQMFSVTPEATASLRAGRAVSWRAAIGDCCRNVTSRRMGVTG